MIEDVSVPEKDVSVQVSDRLLRQGLASQPQDASDESSGNGLAGFLPLTCVTKLWLLNLQHYRSIQKSVLITVVVWTV